MLKQVGKMVFVAVCLGLLEAAWTTPTAPGATRAGLGCFAIGAVLAVVCWPKLWWVPGLSMLQEATQVIVGQSAAWRPNWDWFFNHWSAGYFGVNLYPAILFPLITIFGEGTYLWLKRTTAPAVGDAPGVEAAP
ncbi:MAG TPA: hypothetical protein PKI11_14065 [Candidatus Hydrogenedentes bacterium]|nr:hypothetical protein [Candidatus Hydrogenedentota bacterium]HNT87738.1 hypothetical protein [Candidatus Hydrogenedentota bacterium]